MGLIADVGRGPLGIDTPIFIYFIEEHPAFQTVLAPVFAAIDGARLQAVTSAVTLLETLIVPYRAGDAELAERYETVLTGSRGVRLVDLDRALLRSAAQLRAASSIKTPDALQVAAALRMRCTAYLTNDRELPLVPGLRVLQLRDYARRR
jgi:predicted nucleic acid-binding protein